jgi:hypothetical protein
MSKRTSVIIPRENVNDEMVTLVNWCVENGTFVEVGQALADVEGSKAVFTTASVKLRRSGRCDQEVSKRTLATPQKVCEEVSHKETRNQCEPRNVRVSLPRRADE